MPNPETERLRALRQEIGVLAGQRIRLHRQLSGLSGWQVASRAGIGPETLYNLETGTAGVDHRRVYLVSRALELRMGDVYGEADTAGKVASDLNQMAPEYRQMVRELIAFLHARTMMVAGFGSREGSEFVDRVTASLRRDFGPGGPGAR